MQTDAFCWFSGVVHVDGADDDLPPWWELPLPLGAACMWHLWHRDYH